MVTLLRSEPASGSCNYIQLLSSTIQYRNDARKCTDDIYLLFLRGGPLIASLKVINTSSVRTNPAFPAGTGPTASFQGPEDYVLGCLLAS